MSSKRAANSYQRKRNRTRFGIDVLEPRLLLSAYAFDDEFNETLGGGPSSAWGAENATDPNNGAVHYTNTLPAQATKNNPATMQIVSDPLADDGSALAMTLEPSPTGNGTYDSAEISTRIDPSGLGNSLEYGHIEARIRIPGGSNSNAIWPAFWMLGTDISQVGWPYSGEVDIMENKGSQPGTISSTLHGPQPGANENDYNGGGGVSASYSLASNASFYSSYHVFAVDWGPNSVTFSVDGNPYYTLTPANLPSGASWVFNGHPFYIILDVNEGGGFAPGTITTPQTMYVDYVHASSYSVVAVPPLGDSDIGSPALAGSADFDGITNTVNGGGTSIGGTSDQFNFDSQVLSGNVTMITSVDWIGQSAQFAKGGLMVRNGLAANAAYAFVQINPPGGNGATFEYRTSAGAAAVTAGTDSSINLDNGPVLLKLVRSGNTFSAYDSTNGGSTWKQIGPSETISMSNTANVGLADDGNSTSSIGTDTFSDLSILPGAFSDTNIGLPSRVGNVGFANSNSVWDAGGGGVGITSTSDQFNLASESLTGDGSIIADFQSMTGTSSLAATGIMFRNDTTTSAAFAMLAEQSGGKLTFEWRPTAGAAVQSSTVSAAAPWIKLLRTGNSFTAFYSADDVNWFQLGTAETVTMGSTALVGTAVTAGDNTGQLNVATFNLVSAANAANNLVYLTSPSSTTAGDAFPSTVSVAVEDVNGNVVQSDNSNVTISVASGSAALQGTVTVTAKNGIATFNNLATSAPGTGTIEVTDGTLAATNSGSIAISNPPGVSAASAVYTITGYPGSETMDVQAGTVTLSSDQSANFTSLGLTIESGASVLLQSDQHLASIVLNGSGSLNVNNCAVYINYGSNPDPISTIAGDLTTGYNGGSWNGGGIDSTAANINSASYGVGYADSADSGNPAQLPSGTIKIMYTLLGDADLNGIVNGIDFGILAANFNQGVTGWDKGDFDYNNIVNGLDFGDLSSNFNKGDAGTAVEAVSGGNQTIASTPTSLVFTTQPKGTTAGSTISTSVAIEDQFGNVDTSDDSAVTLIATGPGGLNGTTTEDAINGVATFSVLSLDASGSYILSASDSADALAAVNSGSFNVAPAKPSKLIFSTQPATTTIGKVFSTVVTIDDQFGNVETADNSTVKLAVAGNQKLGGVTTIKAVDGVATFSDLVLGTVGTYTLVATDPNDGLAGVHSSLFAVNSQARDVSNPRKALLEAPNINAVLATTPTVSKSKSKTGAVSRT